MSTALSTPPDVPRAPVQRPSRGARVRWVVVALTGLAIVGYVVAVYTQGSLATLSKSGAGLSTTYAGRALPIQVAFYCHISFAALALLVGPLQFVVAIRRRRPLLHRWIGRVFLVSARPPFGCLRRPAVPTAVDPDRCGARTDSSTVGYAALATSSTC